jgi:hypothetical protein
VQKENDILKDKVERLDAMLKAGDRIARAAASLGEKRQINTLTEEVEEESEDGGAGEENTTSGGQMRVKMNGTSDPNDVDGTVS